MDRPPLILLSNDDGVEAPGLRCLREALSSRGELLVVAPDGERSATSHAVQMAGRFDYERREPGCYAVDASPADCVYLGVTQLAPRPPDLVVAGINDGYNLGTDVLYSGTVAAAAEGVVLSIPGIALSTDRGVSPDTLGRAARFGSALAGWVLDRGWRPAWTLLNVNVPGEGQQDRFRVTAMGTRVYRPASRQRDQWPARGTIELRRPGAAATHGAEGEDAEALASGIISVSPLRLDWTNPDELPLRLRLELDGFESGRGGE